MKKLLVILLVLALCVSLIACTSNSGEDSPENLTAAESYPASDENLKTPTAPAGTKTAASPNP